MTDEGRSRASSDLLHTPTRCLPQTESQQEAGEAEMVPHSLNQAPREPGQAGPFTARRVQTLQPVALGEEGGPHTAEGHTGAVSLPPPACGPAVGGKRERDGVTIEIEAERLPLSRHRDTTTPPCTTQDPAAGVGVDQPAGEGGIWPR